ncbi:MAG TPA: AmmeMemoRadiSam system protein B [Vicinamibacteria bacterium]|nr:AmmeMemoRadiSam system protein B [Vicinamibacteria bacterium]
MSELLPRLRRDLDVMRSPLPDAPGVLLRDPMGYTETMLVIAPPWDRLLMFLDGFHTELDARAALTRLQGGRLAASEDVREFVDTLEKAGFLETERLATLKRRRQEAFRSSLVRVPSHAGTAYPAERAELETFFDAFLGDGIPDASGRTPRAIAAPHVAPDGGRASYGAAYQLDGARDGNELDIIVLGTSHYGEPEHIGVTRKPFRSPLGEVPVAIELVERLLERGGDAVIDEDYSHVPEHSIEFQVIFLQHRLRRPFRIVPILVGAFADSLITGKRPEALDSNRRCFDALSELADANPNLFWVLGVDMAHVGRRYGGSMPVRAGEGEMVEVAEKDRERLAMVCDGDAEGFFDLVSRGGDELNWCGYSPLYAFLHAVAPVLGLEGSLRHYEQWNIDAGSVVTFGAIHFHETE